VGEKLQLAPGLPGGFNSRRQTEHQRLPDGAAKLGGPASNPADRRLFARWW
jgi:hypothetical protein